MSVHRNDITVHEVLDGRISIHMSGSLSEYIKGLECALSRKREVKDAFSISAHGIIVVELDPLDEGATEHDYRIRIRNYCRDWVCIVTGFLSNFEGPGDFVDLIEDSALTTT